MQFEPFLMAQLKNTDFGDRSSPSFAPLCTPIAGTTLLNAFSDVTRVNPISDPPAAAPLGSREAEGAEEVETQKQLRRVLELMVVLWGDLPTQCSTGESESIQ